MCAVHQTAQTQWVWKEKGNVQTSSPYWSYETNCNDLQLSHHRLGINAGTSSTNHKHMMVTAATLQKASNIVTAARELTADQWHHIYLYSTFKKSPLNNTLFSTMTFSTFILVWYCLVITFWVVLSCVSWSYCHSVLTILITWMHCQTYSWSDHVPKMSDQEEHEKAAGVVPKSSTCHHSVTLHMDAHILILELCICWEVYVVVCVLDTCLQVPGMGCWYSGTKPNQEHC